MIYDGILTKGFCREEFLKQIEQLRQIPGKKVTEKKPPDGISLKMQQQLEAMEQNMYVNPAFLLTYTLLENQGVYQWSENLPPERKQEWRECFDTSEYNNTLYKSYFTMRQTAELDWLTGLILKTGRGEQDEYQMLIHGISDLYSFHKQFVKKREVVKSDEISKFIKNEDNELLQAGEILLFFILSEFYHIPIIKNDGWSRLESLLWKGLQFYQFRSQSEKHIPTKKFKNLFDSIMVRQGIHPISLREYDSLPYQAPDHEICKEYDWQYLWSRLFAILECLKANKESYRQLKRLHDFSASEHLNRQIGELQKEIKAQNESILYQKEREKELCQHVEVLEKENQELNFQTKTHQSKSLKRNRELIQLRNFVYQLENESAEDSDSMSAAVEELQGIKVLVIGGHVNWQQRMKELFPDWRFLSGFQTHFSIRAMTSVQYFLVHTKMLKHKGYYHLLSECDARQNILYCNEVNIERSIQQIYRQLPQKNE